jgi:hypothetical protein
MAARVTQLSIEAFITPTGAARVTQIAIEAFVAIGLIAGGAGIASGEAFGSGGTVTVDSGSAIVGDTGIASGEAFGSGVVAGPITGASGIVSGEAFGSTGSLVAGLIRGEDGIISREAFGVGGYVSGPINGLAGIPSGEAFGAGSVSGPVTGTAGIVSAGAFGSGGSVVGPVTGAAGIVSGQAFGSGGSVYQLITGSAGIVSAEAFGSGEVLSVTRGYFGIPSAEAFGRSGAVIGSRDFTLYIGGYDWTPLLRESTLNWNYEWGGRGGCTFQLQDGDADTPAVWRPGAQAEVVFYVGSQRVFGGFVQSYTEECLKGTKAARFDVRCTDYTVLADWRTFSRTYTGPSFDLATIVQEIFDATLAAEGISFTSEETVTVTGSRLVFEDEPVAGCLDRIAMVFGCDWSIDQHRRLRVWRSVYEPAPYTVIDGNGVIEEMKVTRTDKEYRNRQGARTALPVAGQRQSTLAGAGAWTYTLPFAVSGKPRILVDDVAAVVVLYSQRHLGPWDFAYTENSAVLHHNPAQSAYTSSNTIAVTARSQNLDVLWYDNTEEQERRALRTGGSGIVESVIPARNIRDKGVAESVALQMLKRAGSMRQEVDLTTLKTGWMVGQQVAVSTKWPLAAGLLLVQSLQGHYVGNTFVRYQLKLIGYEPPLIQGLSFDGIDTITVTTEYPHGLGVDDGISIWGVNGGDGSGINWNGWTVGTVPTPTTFTIPTGGTPFIPGEWPGYTGGAGGPSEGQPLLPGGGSGFPTGGGGEGPGGGFIFTGPGPSGGGFTPGSGSGSGGVGDPGLIVTAVNVSTRTVTVHRAHGFTTSTPTGGTRVRIAGITGTGSDRFPQGFNTQLSRITVVDTTSFVLEDASNYSADPGFEPFQDDRRGRVYTSDQIIRVTPGTGGPGSLLGSLNAAVSGVGSSNNVDRATFLLANSIPGVASRPLQVTSGSATSPWVMQSDLAVVESVSAIIGTPPTGASVLIDVKKNGASIFAGGSYLEIPAGQTEVVRTIDFSSTPTTVERDDELTVQVVQVGSDFAGCNAVVNVALRK